MANEQSMITSDVASSAQRGWLLGARDALPLFGGYISVALSFGLVATQAGFTVWQACLVSGLVYAGASQFLFVAMVAAGAPLWLVVAMTLLVNARHVVYAPTLAASIPSGRHWLWLMHGLTDQLYAMSHSRLPQLPASARLGWYCSAAGLAWLSWVFGTWLGAVAGAEIIRRWPLLAQILPFALPALFIVLLAPRFSQPQWAWSLSTAIAAALLFALVGASHGAVVLAALCGMGCFLLLNKRTAMDGD